MPDYRYTAIGTDGASKQGVASAGSETELAETVRRQGSTLTSATPVAAAVPPTISWRDRLNKIAVVDKVFFTENLRVMVHAGLPLGRALTTLGKQITNKYFRKVITGVRERVEGGVALSTALGEYNSIFPQLYVAMIAAGEGSGKLDEVLTRLAKQLKKDYALKAKIRNAMIYPTVVIVGIIAVAILMMVVVLPKITVAFTESNTPLPLPTRILMSASNFLIKHGVVVAAIVVGLIILLGWFRRTPNGRRLYDRALLRLPIAGKIIQKVGLANFTRSFSSLLSTDIPIVQTFTIIAKTMGNVLFRDALIKSGDRLKTGISVVKALEEYPRLFPPIVTQMIAIGEESGTLESVSAEIADFYEEDVDQTVANLSTILEPLIILILGLGVAGIALAVILPIYSLGSTFD